MRDILWLVKKTLSVTFRKKKNIIMYLFMPLVGIIISLMAYNGDNQMKLNIGVVNQDPNDITNETIQFLKSLDNAKITIIDGNQIKNKITNGKLDSVVTFEKGYSDSILKGVPDHIQLTSIKGAEINSYVKSYLYQYIDNLTSISQVTNGDAERFKQIYKNSQNDGLMLTTHTLADESKNKAMTNQTIGFLIMIMLMSAGNLSEIILSEKENRTYFRLLSTPINARKYIFSNVIVNMIVMAAQILITLTIMTNIFHISLNTSFWEATVVMLFFALISIGLSLVTVSFSNSRAAAGGLQNLIIMPTVMLSGCFWPVEVMPKSIQKIAEFLPQRWTLETLSQLQDGMKLNNLYLNLMILLAFALAFFLIAIYNFSKNNDTRNFV